MNSNCSQRRTLAAVIGVKMRKVLVVTAMLLAALTGLFAADPNNAVSVTIASIVKEPVPISPHIVVGITTASISYTYSTTYSTETGEAISTADGVDLSKDGSFTFALITSDEVNVIGKAQRAALSIEITADGFHLYEDAKADMEGFALSGSTIKKRNAVPIKNIRPEINIPGFYGKDENVEVNHLDDNNRIEIMFNPGRTRSDLTIGTFKVDWDGQQDVEKDGNYRAEISVVYCTL